MWLCYDDQNAYYLAGGTDAKFYGSGSMSLLLWKAIQESIVLHKKVFDFEGSMVNNVNKFFKNFGTQEIEYISQKSIIII